MHEINEARRNTEMNPKKPLDISAYFEGEYYLSFTTIPKIGIKPDISWTSTPLGVYAYPLYIPLIQDQIKKRMLPYGMGNAYAAILKPNGNNLKLSTVDQTMVTNISKKIHDMFPDSSTSYGVNPAATLWETIREAATYLDKSKVSYRFNFRHRHPAMWSALIRRLGYDAITDDVGEIIHSSEELAPNPFLPKKITIKTPQQLAYYMDQHPHLSGQRLLHASRFENDSIIVNGIRITLKLSKEIAAYLGDRDSTRNFGWEWVPLVIKHLLKFTNPFYIEMVRTYIVHAYTDDQRKAALPHILSDVDANDQWLVYTIMGLEGDLLPEQTS